LACQQESAEACHQPFIRTRRFFMGRPTGRVHPGVVNPRQDGRPFFYHGKGLAERLAELGRQCAALPDYDTRSPEEIVGYDEFGMWT
jgi:hypothetical protein